MLVTCPECEQKISDVAEVCYKCGFSPSAGRRSKEYCQKIIEQSSAPLQWDGFKNLCDHNPKLSSAKVIKEGESYSGFGVQLYYNCGICHKVIRVDFHFGMYSFHIDRG